MNLYLAEKFPAAHLLPATLEERARVHRWLFFQAGHVTPACLPLFRATNARVKAFWNPALDLPAAEAGRKELARFLPVLAKALEEHDWLEGQFSLADIAFAPHLWLVAEGGFSLEPWPRVRAWLERILARPAWQKARALIFE